MQSKYLERKSAKSWGSSNPTQMTVKLAFYSHYGYRVKAIHMSAKAIHMSILSRRRPFIPQKSPIIPWERPFTCQLPTSVAKVSKAIF